eukprot:TRINITY_DN7712_c0_g1_i1.p1 TRINITY_DN7712_c0_g1~~TRINITY_DN7712_c0_g1_i1.p1  ORF type:complete len:248 (-),score=28.05 TRINITY_DN7712_c0_g1_i1:117-860(-)
MSDGPRSVHAGTSHPISSVALEVANTLFVSFMVTEVVLRSRCWREMRIHAGICTAVNMLLSPRLWSLLDTLYIAAASSFVTSRQADGGGGIASTAGTATVTNGLLPFHIASPVVRFVLRLVAVFVGFSILSYFDVRSLRQQPYTAKKFAAELGSSLWHVLPVYPFLVIGFSCILLVMTSVLVKIGLSEHIGEELIFYGQFYAPFSVVYWTIKKEWLTNGRGEAPLPLHIGVGALGGGAGRRLGRMRQ